MRISDWSSDVCSSDLDEDEGDDREEQPGVEHRQAGNAFLQPGRGRDQEAGDDQRRDRPAQRDAARKAAQPLDAARQRQDRKSVVWGKRVSVRVDLGGRRCIKKTTTKHTAILSPKITTPSL